MATKYDVIVVGLGVAGTTALGALARNGKSVLGLEADNRIGGRVKTIEFGDGVVELGAEWIHGTVDSKVHDLATAAGVDVVSQAMDVKVFRSDGREGDTDLVNSLIDYCLGDLWNPNSEQPEPLGQYVERECRAHIVRTHPELAKDEDFMTEFFAFMNLLMNNYEASNDWDDVTTGSSYRELDGDQHMSWHRHGYGTLFDIVLNQYKNGPGLPNSSTLLNKEVTNIASNGCEVTALCSDGTRYIAASVIVTVSLGVLKERHSTLFSPPLSKEKIEAIENMSIGVMDKVILSFDKVWWPLDKHFFAFIWRGEDKKNVAPGDTWTTKLFGASTPMGSSNVLTLWTSGETAKLVEVLPEDVVKRKLVELLQKFMGGDLRVPEPVGMIRSLWHSNKYTRGSYTHDSVRTPHCSRAREVLAEPILDAEKRPRILFAGEATNPIHFSTVHGAMETGIREANRILGVKCKI